MIAGLDGAVALEVVLKSCGGDQYVINVKLP
jgi:hypothetical protein